MTETSKHIEVMARAYCLSGGFDPDERMANDGPRWRYYVPGITAAHAALFAAGYEIRERQQLVGTKLFRENIEAEQKP